MGSRHRLSMFSYEDPFSSQETQTTGVDFAALEGRVSCTDGGTLLAAFKSEDEVFMRQRCTSKNPASLQSTALYAQAATTSPNTRNTLTESPKGSAAFARRLQ